VRLVLLTDTRGLPLGYTLVPANEKEYEPLADLLTGTPAEVVVADKGLWGRDYSKRLAALGTHLPTPEKRPTTANEHRERRLASTRLVIESVFANLKTQMRLERHLAKTPAGLAVRIAHRLRALTLGILLNTLQGRRHAPSPPTTAAKPHQTSSRDDPGPLADARALQAPHF
jgi:Transposase DDE domain